MGNNIINIIVLSFWISGLKIIKYFYFIRDSIGFNGKDKNNVEGCVFNNVFEIMGE